MEAGGAVDCGFAQLLDRIEGSFTVGVAQLVERRIVVPVAEGSNPSTHPILNKILTKLPFAPMPALSPNVPPELGRATEFLS